jgi:glutathione S-transferase
MFLDPPDPKAVEQSRRALHTTLSKMDRELAQSGRWLAGSNYSLADIAAAPVIDRIQRLGMADMWAKLSAVKEWVERA